MSASLLGPAEGASLLGPVTVAEIERKFDVPAGFTIPELSDLPGVVQIAEPVPHRLDATYFDTPDLRLVANRITLRRRTGGDDAGWHLKRPRADGDRDELRVPLGRISKTVPTALLTPVAVHLRGATPLPVVRLVTARTVHRLLGDDGVVLVEIAQDDVTASRPQTGGQTTRLDNWSELEVELVGGDQALLDAVVERVIVAGATASLSASKLSRALGDSLPARRPQRPEGVKKRGAAAVLFQYLREQVERLKVADPLVRADEHDAVHQMRIAARRLRSAFSTFRPMLDRAVTAPLRGELQWLGTALGAARDAEVTRDHLRGLVEAQPAELVLGPVVERIVESLDARYRAAHDEVLADLDTSRYFDLLDTLDRLVDDPPFTPLALGRADDVLLPLVAKTFQRIHALVQAAQAETDPHHHDELLHEVRKAAKRARYAGEALTPSYGKPAKAWAARMEGLQEALGEHQDTVAVRSRLLTLAEEAAAVGENTFTYGRLHGLEDKRAADTEYLFDRAWTAAQAKRLHRWLNG
jgi:CHAD domain-containing protein